MLFEVALCFLISEFSYKIFIFVAIFHSLPQKIQKVTGGLTRLASRTKSKKEEPTKTRCILSGLEIQTCAEQHIGLVRALVDVRRKEFSQHMIHMQRIVYEEWLETETELTRERGLWGPPVGSRYNKIMTLTLFHLVYLLEYIS